MGDEEWYTKGECSRNSFSGGAGVYDAVSRISHGYAVNSDVGASYSSGRKQDRRKDF